jgi:rfaE bifunctional protein kinase chain/domain
MMDWNLIFETFQQKKILIIGDVMIDAYLYGSVSRISPEAPVPIVNFSQSENRLGGAANVALNVASLGGTAIMLSIVGKDENAQKLIQLLQNNQLTDLGIVQSSKRRTTVKTRIIGNKQHLLRIDDENCAAISADEELLLLQKLEQFCKRGIDAMVFEDYNKGVFTPTMIEKSIAIAKKYNIPTAVDPKKDNFFAYKGVTLFKPNFKELKEGLGLHFSFQKGNEFEAAVTLLQEKLNAASIFVTLSEHGVYIQNKAEKHYIPAHYRTISDVSGAGDTVISVAAMCLAAGVDIENMAKIANLAGGLVCEKVGVVSIQAKELLDELNKNNS